MKLIMKLQKSADDADWQFAQGPMDGRIMLSFIGNASADTNPTGKSLGTSWAALSATRQCRSRKARQTPILASIGVIAAGFKQEK
jgi:hypothetical protein